ncbi:MAG: SRPBCC family protein [Cyclobacteriaceae bacterium]
MSSVNVSTEIMIKRPVDQVAAYASDPDNATQWYANIKSVEWKTSKEIRVGSKIEFMAQFLGKRLIYTYEIVEFVPNQKFVMRTADGPFPMETTYSWKSLSENETKMILINRGSPAGFSKFLAPFMSFAMRNANRKDLSRIKQILENKS